MCASGEKTVSVTETSAMISLGEIMTMESRRASEEAEYARRKALEELTKRQRAQEEHRRALADREQAATRQRQAHERQECEDAARLVGLMLGLMSRAKIEAEARELRRRMDQEHQHNLDRDKARSSSREARLRWLLAISMIIQTSLLLGSLSVYVWYLAPAQYRELALAHTTIIEKDSLLATADRQRDQQASRITSLERAQANNRDLLDQAARELARLRERAQPW